MFCPKCATQNVEGASFCRSCGANVSLIPQALSGQLPTARANEAIERAFGRKRRKEPSLDEAIRHLVMGIAFVVVSILIGRYSPGGWTWWYWMLIPAATFLGRGISDIVRLQQAKTVPATFAQPQMSPGTRPPSLPVQRTGELMAPVPSVTEGTTRHLGAEAPTRHFDPLSGEEKLP
jgi:zinc-ribbon domain